jgi:hypothetical protein
VSAPFDDWPDLPELPELFEPIEPLPGGLAQLRRRVDRERQREKRRAGWLWLAPLAAGVAVLALWLQSAPVEPAAPPLISGASALPHPSAIALGLAPPTPSASGDVVFVWVDASQPRPPPIYVEPSEVDRLEAAPLPVAVIDP